ncbi:hypothetical protein AB0H83_46720 [Dactylosporangium sp. NPDC050688]|uniref:hypothetical protein n=1 Tax=Dactylosporangium sp. NPDC050688 TaxID=3157217 RepID=UPI00340170C4
MAVNENTPQSWDESFIDLDDLELPEIQLESLDEVAGGSGICNTSRTCTATITCKSCGQSY